ncbi:MAG: NAD(P)/FAD-dependent oxidoreductase [Aestuariivirga sp.]
MAAVFDVMIVGAGPSGLMAADVLSAGGVRVRIIDHMAAPARKFLLAGRGGLNLTHSEPLETLLDRYGEARARLEPAIRAFPPEAVREWCHGLGIETFVGSSGRVFPKSMKASPLLRALLRRLDSRGVKLDLRTEWKGFEGSEQTILAMGGASWPHLGSDAAWVEEFRKAGIKVTPFQPSNGRQRVNWSPHFASRFAGQPVKNVQLSCGGQHVRGEIMISSDGIEGGAVYALSRVLREDPGAPLVVDLRPSLSEEEVSARLAARSSKESRSNRLRKALGLTPVAISLMRECGTENPKSIPIAVQGPAGIARAISSAGGVSWSEIDETFRLRRVPHVQVVGEMTNWDAPTGGYLLQACFSTAYAAARAVLAAPLPYSR